MDGQCQKRRLKGTRAAKDLMIILAMAIVTFLASSYFDIFEKFVGISSRYEYLQLDEVIIVLAVLAFAMMLFSARRLRELTQDLWKRNQAEETLRRVTAPASSRPPAHAVKQ